MVPDPSALMLPNSSCNPPALSGVVMLRTYDPFKLPLLKFFCVTFTSVDAFADPECTLTEIRPNFTPLTVPLLTVATEVSVEPQLAVEVMSFVEPSLKVAVAFSCRLFPTLTAELEGEIAIDVTVGAAVVVLLLPELVDPTPQLTRQASENAARETGANLKDIPNDLRLAQSEGGSTSFATTFSTDAPKSMKLLHRSGAGFRSMCKLLHTDG